MRYWLAILMTMLISSSIASADDNPWPADVPGFKPLKAGEHPRLLFREADLPALRRRAQTPEGKAILDRLRRTLDGKDGTKLPDARRSPDPPHGDKSTPIQQPEGTLSISHPAGYGLLYQLTGDKRYAELGKQSMQLMLDGYRDRDGKARYSFRDPSGPLRAGPSLGWVAVGYDLCYDGWDEDFRKKVCDAIEHYNEGRGMKLEDQVKGRSHFPASNHWGMQVGGGAMALLAITGDPEVQNQGRIDKLLKESEKAMIRNVTEGFGDGGYFAEGDGPGSMASHIIYLSALQAWKTSAGKDFITPRPNARWTALKWFLLTVPDPDKLRNLRSGFPERGGYPHNIWARPDGVSGSGYFSIGYEAVLPQQRLALWALYHQWGIKQWDEKNRTPFDTVGPYPHHSVLAFVNTPLGEKGVKPEDVIPRYVHDTKHGFFAFRNRWQDENDIVISMLTKRSPARFRHGPDRNLVIQSHGKKSEWGKIPTPATTFEPVSDGSAIIGNGQTWLAIDFSGASGADGLLVMVGEEAARGDQTIEAGGVTYQLKYLTDGKQPVAKAQGDAVIVGRQVISMQEGKLTLKEFAKPWSGPAKLEDAQKIELE